MAKGHIKTQQSIILNGVTIAYTLLRMVRRRHTHLVIENDMLVARVPYQCGRAHAEQMIRTHATWVVDSLNAATLRARRRPHLIDGDKLPLFDDYLTLRIIRDTQLDLFEAARAKTEPNASKVGNELRVQLFAQQPTCVRTAVEHWYRTNAHAALTSELSRLADWIGVQPAKVSIRAQKTCWGSCTSTGNISLNWRLQLVPWRLAEYVLVHELCHLVFLDHSARFWQLVGRFIPDFRDRRSHLRDAQQSLAF